MGYFLGLIKCPKVGGPDTLAAHKSKKWAGRGPPGRIASAAYGCNCNSKRITMVKTVRCADATGDETRNNETTADE